MRKLILVKHSHPEIIQTKSPKYWHLSNEGKIKSKLLANTLSDYSPFEILSSEESKAKETADIIAHHHDNIVHVEKGLHEHERENSIFMDIEKWTNTIKDFFENPSNLIFGNETANQAKNRFSMSVNNILKKVTIGNIAIIAHGTVITLFCSIYNNIDLFQFWERLGLPSFVVLSIPDFKINEVIDSIY